MSSKLPGQSNVNEKQFRNVFIIVTLNGQKDEITNLRCHRFAAETKQQLINFYSIDRVPSKENDETHGEPQNKPWSKKHSIAHSVIPDNI